jgi:hypothetical protein
MANQLLIVTCDLHRWQFLVQCKSIYTYLEPCQINVVINERDSGDWLTWFNIECRPYFVNHTLVLYTFDDFNSPYIGNDGYASQQSIKLLFSYKTDEEYITLDTKNWFVKPINLNEIPRQGRGPNLINKERFNQFYLKCLEKFGDNDIRHIETPYIINPTIGRKLIESFKDESFLKWFTDFDKHPSEYMCYDMFAQSIGEEQDPGLSYLYGITIWNKEELYLWPSYLLDNYKILGIHFSLIEYIDKEEIEKSLNLNIL